MRVLDCVLLLDSYKIICYKNILSLPFQYQYIALTRSKTKENTEGAKGMFVMPKHWMLVY